MEGSKMDFMEAVNAMKEGKKVRRKAWEDGSELYWSNPKDDMLGCFEVNGEPMGKNFLDIHIIEATDWEVVEEKKTLFDKCGADCFDTCDVKEALKEFIEETKQAILKREQSRQMANIAGFGDEIDDKANEIFGKELIE
jgi:hypothetical protein